MYELFFGPLDKRNCAYFLLISILFFITLVILVANEMYYLFSNMHRLNFRMISSGILIIFNAFIAYFVNRLLYSMCNKSLA